jgi:hypothetical protein
MDLYCEIYDGRQGLEICALFLVSILMSTDGFEPLVTDGITVLFEQKMY